MLGGLALKRRWQHARRAAGKPTDRPNIVMGVNVQVCWEKFANYFEVEPRLVPMDGDRLPPRRRRGRRARATRTRSASSRSSGSTFDGSYEPVARDLRRARRPAGRAPASTSRCTSTARPGAMIAPFFDPDLVWDFRLPRVASINTSGHKYGLVYPGVGWVAVARRRSAARGPGLPGQLPRRRHADVRAELLPAGRAGGRAVLQLPAPRPRGLPPRAADLPRRGRRRCPAGSPTLGPFRLLTDGRELPVFAFTVADARRRLHASSTCPPALREQGWLVPAYTFPAHREDLAALRIVVRNGFTHDLADLLLDDLTPSPPPPAEPGKAPARHRIRLLLPRRRTPAVTHGRHADPFR